MSVNLDFDFAGLDQLQRRLESELNKLTRDAVTAAGKVTVAKAKQGNFKDHTRQLRSTISSRHIGQRGNWYVVEVRAPMHYASYVEHGTDKHDIWPKAMHGLNGPLRQGQTRRATGKGPHEYIVGRGIALRWKVGGQEFFARMVKHPGSRAIPFMEPAREYGQAYIETFIRRGFAGISARLESHG
jgi:hypothetical protein